MEIRFPRLLALAKRMVPGAYEDPMRVIGACAYCDGDVLYKDGDVDGAGRARHDACERDVTRSQLDRVSADRVFIHALAMVRDLPTVLPHAKAAMRAMPARYGAREMAAFIDAMIPHVALEPALGLRSRRDAVVSLRETKRALLGLRHAPRNETRPT